MGKKDLILDPLQEMPPHLKRFTTFNFQGDPYDPDYSVSVNVREDP